MGVGLVSGEQSSNRVGAIGATGEIVTALVMLAALWLIFRLGRRRMTALRAAPVAPTVLAAWAGAAAGAALVVMLLLWVMSAWPGEAMRFSWQGRVHWWYFTLGLVVAQPLWQELLFRGLWQPAFERAAPADPRARSWTLVIGLALSPLLPAMLMLGNARGDTILFLTLSIIAAQARLRTGSLRAALAVRFGGAAVVLVGLALMG